jgi:hypothetical protein
LLAAVAVLMAVACSGGGKAGGDAGGGDEVTRAQALAAQAAVLPSRPEVIALAQSVEALALKEGAGARAVELHALAAHLHERIWRTEHREQDAKEAVDIYRSAGRDLALPGACHAAARGQGNLRLSMFGDDPAADYDAIVRPYLDGTAFDDRIGVSACPIALSESWPAPSDYGGPDSPEYAQVVEGLVRAEVHSDLLHELESPPR